MATYRKRDDRIQAIIRIVGHKPEHRMFATRKEARAWAEQREEDLRLGRLTSTSATVGDALKRYARDVSPTKRGERWERLRLNAMGRDWGCVNKPIASLTSSDIASWRDSRLKDVQPSTVAREMIILSSVLSAARREWKWISENPMADVRKPTSPPPRRRRISSVEIDKICLALGYEGGLPTTTSHRVALAFLFAIETAMRAGEIVGIHRCDVHANYIDLPRTKNGDSRQVPLSRRAIEILELLPNTDPVFYLNSAVRDTLFRRARDATELDLHFHDARAEAIWRLSKKLDVLQLARMIGHRDINSLRLYYNESPQELAKRLE